MKDIDEIVARAIPLDSKCAINRQKENKRRSDLKRNILSLLDEQSKCLSGVAADAGRKTISVY